MAYQAQLHFLRMRFPHELAFMPDTSQFIAKSYGSCCDPRSWSLDHNERSQYYLELLNAPIEYEPIDTVEEAGPDRPRRPRPDRGAGESVGIRNQLEAKTKEIDDLNKRLKELEALLKAAGVGTGEQSGSGAKVNIDEFKDKSQDDCLKELERMKKELQKKNDELEKTKQEIEKVKAGAGSDKGSDKPKQDKPGSAEDKVDGGSKAGGDDCEELRKENEKLKKELNEATANAKDLNKKLENALKAGDAKKPADDKKADDAKRASEAQQAADAKRLSETKPAGGTKKEDDGSAKCDPAELERLRAENNKLKQDLKESANKIEAMKAQENEMKKKLAELEKKAASPGPTAAREPVRESLVQRPGSSSGTAPEEGQVAGSGAGSGPSSGPGSGVSSGSPTAPGSVSATTPLSSAASAPPRDVGYETPAQLAEELKATQSQISQLNQENEDLRRKLMECNSKLGGSSRPNDPDSGNESDRGQRTDRSEDCEAIRRERDCLRFKFCQLEPELLCLSNMVRDFECLEDKYYQMKGELEERETREIALMNRLQLLMQMEVEFYALQKRVCESEKLLKQYQGNNLIISDLATNQTVKVVAETVVTNPAPVTPNVEANVVKDDPNQKKAASETPVNNGNKKQTSGNKNVKKSQKGTSKCGKCGFPIDELIQTTQATIVAVRTNLQSTNDEKNLAKKLYFGLKNLVKSYEQNYCQFQCGDDDEYDDECNWCTLDYLIVANDEFVKMKLIRECETSGCKQNTVCALQLKVYNLTSCISELNDIVEHQKNDLALAKCEVSGLEDQIRVLRKNIEIERSEYDNIQSQQKVQQLECQLKSKNCEIEKLQSHLKTMDSNLCRLTTQFKELEHNLANARTANNVLKQNYKELNSSFSCQKSEVSDKTVELLQLRKKYECLIWDNKILTENVNCLTEKLQSSDTSMNCTAIQMNEKLNQLMCENHKLKNEVKILNENLNEINCLLSAYECEKNREVDLVKVLDNIDASLTQLSQPCGGCGGELDVAPECRDLYENLNNTIQKLIKQLEIEQMKNCNLEKQIARFKNDLECQPNASDCQKKIFDLQAKLQLYDATNYEKILQIENLKREVKFLSGPADDIQNENQKLLKCVDELKMELKYAMARIEAFEKCELLSERNGKLCERSSQTESKEPTFDLAKLKSLYEKEVNNISKSHCDGLRTLQSLHEMQTCDMRRDHESEIQSLRSQIDALRGHLTNFARGGSDTVLSTRQKTCVCACNGIPPLKKEVANKIEVISKRMLSCGIDKLTFDELCYIHEQIYTAALRLQNLNDTGRATLKKQRSQLENRIKYIEKELKKFRNLLEKLKELQRQKRKLLNSAPPNTRSGTKIAACN